MSRSEWAVVVGASGALGTAICHVLARDGWNLVLGYGRRADAARALAKDIRRLGVDVDQVSLDLSAKCGDALADAVGQRPVRSFVYAAGPHVPQAYLIEIDPEQYQSQVVAESVGFFATLRALLPNLRTGPSSSVVALTSAALRRHPPRDALGVAPKAAIEALVRAAAVEEGRYGVRANSVAVGMIDAGITTRLREEGDLSDAAMERVRRALPLQRFGTPADVAEVVGFLASERSAFMTGQSLAVDGGGSA